MWYPKLDFVLRAWAKRRREGLGTNLLEDLSTMRSTALRADQVARMSAAEVEASDEFDAMLARLKLDTKSAPLSSATRVDLFLHCLECDKRTACKNWLACSSDCFGYRAFCPNAPMFQRLLCIREWRTAASPTVLQ